MISTIALRPGLPITEQNQNRARLVRVLRSAALVALILGVSARAYAAPVVSIKVTLERIRALDGFEGFPGGDADFYACVKIAGIEQCNEDTPAQEENEDDDDISPGWEFSNREVDSGAGTVPIEIEIRDEDGGFRLGDDQADVNPGGGRTLAFNVDIASCALSGNVSGTCDQTIIVSGDEDPRAELRFRVTAGAKPVANDLGVVCTHSPIWPSASDTITITATAVDKNQSPRTVDKIEIWANRKDSPATTVTSTGSGTATLSGVGNQFFYGCRVYAGDQEVWTGWRVVRVRDSGIPGPGDDSLATPVFFTGDPSSRIDLVFFADKDSYTGPTDPQFFADVGDIIKTYLQEPVFAAHQDQMNFWISTEAGAHAGGFDGDDCNNDMPDGWHSPSFDRDEPIEEHEADVPYSFADVAAIVHRRSIRDCAAGGERMFSAMATAPRVFIHETGHRPFGLADEYAPDGGYFQTDEFPNLYDNADDCNADVPNLAGWDGRLGDPVRTGCRSFDDDDGDTWYASDPASNDLMVDNGKARGADWRRMEWLFGECTLAGC